MNFIRLIHKPFEIYEDSVGQRFPVSMSVDWSLVHGQMREKIYGLSLEIPLPASTCTFKACVAGNLFLFIWMRSTWRKTNFISTYMLQPKMGMSRILFRSSEYFRKFMDLFLSEKRAQEPAHSIRIGHFAEWMPTLLGCRRSLLPPIPWPPMPCHQRPPFGPETPPPSLGIS